MPPKVTARYAVGAIRVSTDKQGRDGDSHEDQHNKISMFAAARDMQVKEYFSFMESGSKEIQPMQLAIDYCKNPKNNIQFFINNIFYWYFYNYRGHFITIFYRSEHCSC